MNECGIDIQAINKTAGEILLTNGSMLPIIGYYDHSGSCEEVNPNDATQLVAGNDAVGYWQITVSEFSAATIH